MAAIRVEACISSDDTVAMEQSVHNAYVGGADTIELCADLSRGGLTPDRSAIRVARSAFHDRPGLMVMIRPRAGIFSCSNEDLTLMQKQIHEAAGAGADGIVFGVLSGTRIDLDALTTLVHTAKRLQLTTTFHRAFDAISDQIKALDVLIDHGIDRVLTSGTVWGSGQTTADGIGVLGPLIHAAGNRIEIVIGGGISCENVDSILSGLPIKARLVSVHAHSALVSDGITDADLVLELCQRTSLFR